MESMEEARRGPTLSEGGRLTPINHKILAQMRRANKQLPESKKAALGHSDDCSTWSRWKPCENRGRFRSTSHKTERSQLKVAKQRTPPL